MEPESSSPYSQAPATRLSINFLNFKSEFTVNLAFFYFCSAVSIVELNNIQLHYSIAVALSDVHSVPLS